jgi:DNA-binding SARP family transcriptional activator
MRRSPHISLNALGALLTLAALALLWQLRPGLPALPQSWTAAMSTIEGEELLLFLLWIALAAVLLLIARALLSEIGLAIKQRREVQLDAFSERMLTSPQPSSPTPASLYPIYPDRYVMTLEERPELGSEPAGERPAQAVAVSEPEDTPAPVEEQPRQGFGISVLGPLRIDGRKPLKRAATSEMLAYLALHPPGATRDELIEALWPGQDPQSTLPRLYQSVSDARRAFGDSLIRDRERYRLDRARTRIDLDELDRLLATTGDAERERHALEMALSLWRGQPLAGSDYPWAEGFIHQLHAALLDLLGRVGTARLEADDPRGALQAAERAIALDNLHEPSWRLALQADHALGLYSGVTKRYEALAHLLDEQLGLQPSHDTRMMYRELLGQS